PVRSRAGFPASPPPRMAFAVMTGNGTLFVRMLTTTYVPVTSYVEQDGKQVPRTTYQGETKEGLLRFDPDDFQAFGTDGERLDRKAPRGWAGEGGVPVVVFAGGRGGGPVPPQPNKEGAVLPGAPGGAPPAPPAPRPRRCSRCRAPAAGSRLSA